MDNVVSMQNLVNANGKHNLFGWIIFISTVVLIFVSIYQGYKAISKMNAEENIQERKIKELEMNIRALRGNQYQTVPQA